MLLLVVLHAALFPLDYIFNLNAQQSTTYDESSQFHHICEMTLNCGGIGQNSETIFFIVDLRYQV